MALDERPCIYDFSWPSPEFYRWYEHGGKTRDRPLFYEELVEMFESEGHCGVDADRMAKSAFPDGSVRYLPAGEEDEDCEAFRLR